MKPTLGRIIHVFDHTYDGWKAAIVTEVVPFSGTFAATMFRTFQTVEGLRFYYERENQAVRGGWRWPPREEA